MDRTVLACGCTVQYSTPVQYELKGPVVLFAITQKIVSHLSSNENRDDVTKKTMATIHGVTYVYPLIYFNRNLTMKICQWLLLTLNRGDSCVQSLIAPAHSVLESSLSLQVLNHYTGTVQPTTKITFPHDIIKTLTTYYAL